jgi:hypothetical protein
MDGRKASGCRARAARDERDEGIALLVTLAILVVTSALSSALILWTMTEAQIARGFGLGVEGRYAAAAAAERALVDLAAATDWNAVLDGSARSRFTDGAPAGTRGVAGETTIDLEAVRNAANCAHPWPCSETELAAVTSERPWGTNNPRWQLFAYGRLGDVVASSSDSPFYIIALVADDPSERDGNPLRDADDPADPGAGVIQIRGEAFGPRGSHRAVALTVARVASGAAGSAALRVISWRAVS